MNIKSSIETGDAMTNDPSSTDHGTDINPSQLYYNDKIEILKDIFGASEISLENDAIIIDEQRYRVIDDVIIITEDGETIDTASSEGEKTISSFSNEWESYPEILPEHRAEFEAYFDIINRDLLKDALCLDLGCGIGRWSYFVHEHTENLVLADASRAIFVARKNLHHAKKAVFIKADLRELPFRDDAFDFLFCLGVLHHLEENCLDLTRGLAKYSKRLLIYLYYALDNRPWYFRLAFVPVDLIRRVLSKIRAEPMRTGITKILTWTLYMPMIALGRVVDIFGLGRHVPLYEGYKNSTSSRLQQDVYDRFFTPIEQRVSKKQIKELSDTFASIKFSPNQPYWHFLLGKNGDGK